MVSTLDTFFLLFCGYLFRVQAPWPVSLASAIPNLVQARPGDKKTTTKQNIVLNFDRFSVNSPLIHNDVKEGMSDEFIVLSQSLRGQSVPFHC